jgi:hypothetical protein
MLRVSPLLTTLAILAAAGVGCRQPAPAEAAPVALREGPCWWAVFRTALPPDSVAEHFVRAFDKLGLTRASWTQRGDTTWAHAGPTKLDADWRGATYAARVVAYRRGDSTHFRHFVSVAPPAGGWAASYDSVTADGRHVAINPAGASIGFCGMLGRAAAVHGTAPREPDGEEMLPLWTRTSPEN